MEGFKDFFEMSKLTDIIGNVPQRPDYHAEGDVLRHCKMVRVQLEKAISIMQREISNPNSPLSNLDPNYTEEDKNILRISSFTHDLGKKSSTRIGGIYWQDTEKLKKLYGDKPNLNQARAIGHEQSHYFNPVARELLKSPIWYKMFGNASFPDKKILWFIVNNHMIGREGMSKRMSRRCIDSSGKYFNDRRLKLLLTFVLMDKMGRVSGLGETDDAGNFIGSLEVSAEKIKKQAAQVRKNRSPQLQSLQRPPTL